MTKRIEKIRNTYDATLGLSGFAKTQFDESSKNAQIKCCL